MEELTMSHNDSDIHCGDFPQKISASILPPIIITELLLGLPGNLIALGIFCFRFRFWRPTILFLFNLVLADFLLLMSLPFRIDNLLRGENWVFGDAWCRINLFMIAVNRSASIGFMTAVALDRYFKVVHPLHKVNFMRLRHVAMTVCFIWTVAIALRLPLLVNNDVLRKLENDSYENASLTNKTDENIYLCRSFHPYENPPLSIQLHYLVYILEFFFPLLLILFCSIQIYCVLRQRQVSKKKNLQAMRIVLVIVGVFIICFGPGVVTGLSALYLKTLGNDYCTAFKLNSEVFIVFIGFTYLNSVLDPIIYCFSGSLFRDTFKGSIYQYRMYRASMSIRKSEIGSQNRQNLTFSTFERKEPHYRDSHIIEIVSMTNL